MSSVYDLYQYYLNQAKQQEAAALVNPTVQPTLISQVPVDQGGDEGDSVDTTSGLSVGSGPPSPLLAGIMSIVAPPIGAAMSAQIMADKGMLPGPLNSLFASRASGNVELGLPPAINMHSVFDDFGFGGNQNIGGFTGTPAQIDALASEYTGGGGFSDGTSSASDGGEAGAAAASAAGANDSGDTGGPFAKGGVVLPRKELTGIESLRGRYGKR